MSMAMNVMTTLENSSKIATASRDTAFNLVALNAGTVLSCMGYSKKRQAIRH